MFLSHPSLRDSEEGNGSRFLPVIPQEGVEREELELQHEGFSLDLREFSRLSVRPWKRSPKEEGETLLKSECICFLRVGRRRSLKFEGALGCFPGDNSVLYCWETPRHESPGLTSFPQLNSLGVTLWREMAVFSFPFDQFQSPGLFLICT